MKRTHTLPSSIRLFGLVLCGLVLSACSQDSEVSLEPEVSQEPEVFTGPLLIRDGITFDQNTNEPVTGIIESIWDSGRLGHRQNYTDGELNGISFGYDSLVEKLWFSRPNLKRRFRGPRSSGEKQHEILEK